MTNRKSTRIILPATIGTAAIIVTLFLLSVNGTAFSSFGIQATPYPAPQFTHSAPSEWINSGPLTLKDLRGKVVLIDFWTFDCWNCYRSIPWLNHIEKKLSPQGLQLIGVHSPEFEHEHDINNVIEKVKEFKIQHPVMIDNNFSYWRAMKNRYWPSYYILDKNGKVRGVFGGEIHINNRRAKALETLIKDLLKEAA